MMMTVSTNHKNAGIEGECEFAIYTFAAAADMAAKDCVCAGRRWQKYGTSKSAAGAMKRARVLFRSGRFKKVEVKCRQMDGKTAQVTDSTLKILEQKSGDTIMQRAITAIFAVLSGVLVFALAYFLITGA